VAMDADTLNALKQAVLELDDEHRPQWVNKDAYGYTTEPRDDLDPVGCVICFPHDGSWPCVSALIARDLRVIVADHVWEKEGLPHPKDAAEYDFEALADEAERTEYDVETLKGLPDRRQLPHPSDDIYRDVPR
jgi:hypothetical protein